MTDLSADLALADSEARESRRRVTVDEVMRLADVYRWTPLDSATTAEAALLTAVEALSRAALAPAVPQWMPIETAPKTGCKVILFYMNSNSKPRTVLARWLTDEQAAETDADDVGLEGGWYECIDNWDDYCDVAIHEGEPTHWMPLPAAPSAKEPTP